jgi:hypothetical protein
MIKFNKVAQLMSDNIIGYVLGQQSNLIIEIKVPLFRTAAPAGFLVFDIYLIEFERIQIVK